MIRNYRILEFVHHSVLYDLENKSFMDTKNVVFWDVASLGCSKNRRIDGTCLLHHQGTRIGELGTALAVTSKGRTMRKEKETMPTSPGTLERVNLKSVDRFTLCFIHFMMQGDGQSECYTLQSETIKIDEIIILFA
jgi:hypothetical protein